MTTRTRTGRLRPALPPAVLATALTATLLAATPPASATPSATPSPTQPVPVEALSTEERVAVLDGRVAAAEQRIADADRLAATTVEDVNEAAVEASRTRRAAEEAAAAAARAEADLAAAQRTLGLLASRAYRQGPTLGPADALRGGDAPEAFLDRISLLHQVGREQDREVQRLSAVAVVAAVLRDEAEAAADLADRAEADVAAARRAAETQLDDAVADAEALLAERDRLVVELAALRGTSTRSELSRQQDLSDARDGVVTGDEARVTEAAPAPRSPSPPSPSPPSPSPSSPSSSSDTGAWRVDGPTAPLPGPVVRTDTPVSVPTPRPSSSPTPVPAPAPTPSPSPQGSPTSSATAGQQVVSWARTQLGKAYLWGGEGPDAYDCSGLTLRAWQRGGVSLPHSSRLQYQRVAHVDRSAIRPGDLIFWGSDPADASSIHHVAIYSGGGMMIEAPNSRNVVREVPVRWANTMPYVGRP